MMPGGWLRAIAVAALLGGAVVPRAARADEEQVARALFQRAEISFRDGRFGEALRDYQNAYRQKPLPGFLFNIAQCYRHVGLYEPARAYFRRFIAENPPLAQKKMAEDLLDDLDRLQAQQRNIAAMTGGASTIKVSERTPAMGDLLLLTAADREPLPVAAAPNLIARQPVPPIQQSAPLYRRWWFWTLVGGAVAGGVATAVVLGRHAGGDPQGSLPPINAATDGR